MLTFVSRARPCVYAVVTLTLTFVTSYAFSQDRPLEPGFATAQHMAVANPISLGSLTDDLRSTDAIPFSIKLELKSELDKLIADFHLMYEGDKSQNIGTLQKRFNRLVRKTLNLLREGDPVLFRRLKQSRLALWYVLINRREFYALTDETHLAFVKDSHGH